MGGPLTNSKTQKNAATRVINYVAPNLHSKLEEKVNGTVTKIISAPPETPSA